MFNRKEYMISQEDLIMDDEYFFTLLKNKNPIKIIIVFFILFSLGLYIIFSIGFLLIYDNILSIFKRKS